MDYRLARQSTGWLYLILIPGLHVAYRLMFRKIYLHNRTGVKPNTPVILAANHPTAFIDPIFFTNFFDPPVYNMTRGDIFRKPFFRKLLESCNMFPVFRQRDGYAGRDRNDEVFEFCQKKLTLGTTVNIFVEGEHNLDKRVLPLQKGFARIAFGTYERHRLEDLQIVPVGCNYVFGDRDRDEAKIIVGNPIFVKDYWPLYESSPGKAIALLCSDTLAALKAICYHIEDRADDDLAEQLLCLWRNDHPISHLPIVEHSAPRFFGEKALIDRLNTMPHSEKNLVRNRTAAYFDALGNAGLNDESLTRPEQGKAAWLFFLVLAAPFALLGFLVGWPVLSLARHVARTAVKKREFYTSVLMGVTTLAGMIYVGGMLLTGLATGTAWLVTLALLAPLLAWLSIFWKETLLRANCAWKASRHPERERLLTLRKEIWN